MTGNPAVVLLSGGLDSTTVLAIARSEGYVPYALSFRYGQRHEIELDAAKISLSMSGGKFTFDGQFCGPEHEHDYERW